MVHYMNLHAGPFALIENRTKTIELRLNDEKRKAIRVDDTIVFSKSTEPKEQLQVVVKKIHAFSDFDELYRSLPLEKCGYLPEEIPAASPKDMEKYYSAEKQKLYGVLGIEIELTK